MTFLTNLTLWKKITLLTTLGLLFGVGVFSVLGIRATNQATEAMLQDRLTTARLVADYVDEVMGRALAEVENTAQTIDVGTPPAVLEPKITALESTYAQLLIHITGIYLINADGDIVWSKPASPVNAIKVVDFPNLDQAISKGEANISGLVSPTIAKMPVVLLTSPTGAKPTGGQNILVVAVDLAESSIGGFVRPIRLGDTGYVEIVDQNGVVVTRTDPGPKLTPFEKSDHSGRFAALIAAGEPTRGVCHTCHEPEQKVERKDVLAFVPLSEARWGVIIRQSEEEALAPTRRLRQNLFVSAAGLVTIALLFVLVTTRDIGSRIRLLTVASQRIAEGDFTSQVATLGRDEVGILSTTLDDMRTKLKTSYGDLQQRTKELSSLLSVSEILTSTVPLPELLDAVVAKGVEIISGADAGILLLQNGNGQGLLVQSAVGLDKNAFTQAVAAAGIQSEEGKDAVENAAGAVLGSEILRAKLRSSIAAEVFHRSRHVGRLILVSFRDSRAFTESDSRLLQAIGDYVSIAIERAQLTKEAEEARALHEADRLRSEFISSVSHELRTPLTLIKGYSTSLLRPNVSWDETTQQEFLHTIDEKTDELRDLIDKLLQSAKLEAGALKLEKEPLLIPRLAQKVVEELAPHASQHHLVLKFPSFFPVIEADVHCMEQAIRNLVQNAIKYSPEGGEVVIAGEVNEREIVVSVSDHGIGIPPEHLDKLFQRFYRVKTAGRSVPGSGLGLSIVKGHIEAHGGRVWLVSAVSKGSTFYFSLPLEQTEDSD